MGFKFLRIIFILCFFCYTNTIVYSDDFDDGIGIDDGIAFDDSLTPDVNFSYIKRNAINKAKAIGGGVITEEGASEFLDSGDLFVNSVLIDPGSIINGDINIIVNTNDTTVVSDR